MQRSTLVLLVVIGGFVACGLYCVSDVSERSEAMYEQQKRNTKGFEEAEHVRQQVEAAQDAADARTGEALQRATQDDAARRPRPR
jgi:hypothetical protein